MTPAPPAFSTLQRVEIAEILVGYSGYIPFVALSVLFNESKLLKFERRSIDPENIGAFSTLQRVEIAEIAPDARTA